MTRGGKEETTKAKDVAPPREAPDDNETFGEALSRTGFEPAKVASRVVSQGKRRESLKKRTTESVDR